jgi:hypothetical protein
MKKVRILFVAVLFLFVSCAGMRQTENDASTGLFRISATIQEIKGNNLIVFLRLPEIKAAAGSPIGEITQQIVRNNILLEGMKTEVNGKTTSAHEVRGITAVIDTKNGTGYMPGESINVFVSKKSLAIIDFEVIKRTKHEVGRVTLEGLTSALIEIEQFTVLERSKLKEVMNELWLSLSELAKESQDKVAGKLLIADLIMTGTLSENMGE